MTDKRVHPWSGPKLFTVTASDGRRVSLHEEWYFVHIIARKPEIGWLAEPIEQIKHALIRAVRVYTPTYSPRPLYIGPPFGKGFSGHDCLHVAVEPGKDNRGVVFTVMRK